VLALLGAYCTWAVLTDAAIWQFVTHLYADKQFLKHTLREHGVPDANDRGRRSPGHGSARRSPRWKSHTQGESSWVNQTIAGIRWPIPA
jgi:hypothetical protein